MFYASPTKSGKITDDTQAWKCLNMIGLGFNNTGETTAIIDGRTLKPGEAFEHTGNSSPLSTETIAITFDGDGNNELEYTAQIIPAKYICNE
jgi:hypothetical protein